jgi:hypothetical protein
VVSLYSMRCRAADEAGARDTKCTGEGLGQAVEDIAQGQIAIYASPHSASGGSTSVQVSERDTARDKQSTFPQWRSCLLSAPGLVRRVSCNWKMKEVGRTIIMQQFFDQINVREDHAAAAVAL